MRFVDKTYSQDDYCFVTVCKRWGINPYKERYWRNEIAQILGVKEDTVSKWARPERTSRVKLNRWNMNGRIFAQRGDLIESFQDIVQLN